MRRALRAALRGHRARWAQYVVTFTCTFVLVACVLLLARAVAG